MRINLILFLLAFHFPLLVLSQSGPGDALFVNGSSYATAPNSASLNADSALTIEAWIKPSSFAANSWANVIISKDGWAAGEQGYTLRCGGNGVLSFNIGVQGAWHEATSPAGSLQLNTWQHVAGSFDGSTLRVFVNGIEVGSSNFTGTIAASNYDLNLGRIAYTAAGPRYFSGEIDEVRLWSSAISIGAMRDHMCRKMDNSHPNYADLMAYYRFDGAGINFNDLSPNGNNGTFFGSNTVASGAAIGDASQHNYTSPYNVSLTAPAGEVFAIGSVTGNPIGVQLYRVDDPPSPLNIPAGYSSLDTSKHWGVFLVGGTNPTCDHTLDYNSSNYLDNNNECNAQLLERPDASGPTWTTSVTLRDFANNSFAGSAGRQIELIAGLDSLPFPASASSPTTICQGDTADLSVPSGLGLDYQWLLNGNPLPGDTNNTLAATAAGSYNAVVTSGQCSFTSNAIVVTTIPNPSVSITVNPNLCINAGTDTLIGSPSGGAFSGSGVSGSTFDPLVSGLGFHLVTYTYTDSNGCSASASDSITVFPNPTVFFPGPNTYCENDPAFNMTMATPAGGIYSGPGVAANFFTPLAAGVGTHVVQYLLTDNNGCMAVDSATFFILPVPATPTVTQVGNTLVSSSPTGNQWYNGSTPVQGANDSIFTPPGDGSYSVVVTDPNGCSSDTSNLLIFVGLEGQFTLDFSIQPNPASGWTRLHMETDWLGDFELGILDLHGKLVWEEVMNGQGNVVEKEIPLAGLAPGMYFIRLRMGAQLGIRKLILR